MAPLNIAIIVGSTRPGRNGAAVATWIHEQASSRHGATYELVDLEEAAGIDQGRDPLARGQLAGQPPALVGPLAAGFPGLSPAGVEVHESVAVSDFGPPFGRSRRRGRGTQTLGCHCSVGVGRVRLGVQLRWCP